MAGIFVMMLSFFTTIHISFGDETATKDTSEDEKEIFHLEEIVITGTKTPHTLKDVPVHTVVVTNDDIENASVQTVSDILRSVPGFYAASEDVPGETSWQSKLRGLDINNGYGLILINGQRVKGEGMGEYGYGVNQIPSSMIEKIEVIKGPSSVLYGSDALAGVINIITKSVPAEPLFGIEYASGSNDTTMASVYAGKKEGYIGAYINASINEADSGAFGYDSSRKEEFTTDRMDTKLTYDLNKHLKFNLELATEDKERERIYKTKDIFRHDWYKKYRIAPEVNVIIDDTSSLTINGYYFNWNMNRQESGADSSGFSAAIGDMYYQDVETRYSKTFKNTYQLTIGAEFLQEELDYTYADEIIETYSGYSQLDTDIRNNLSVVLGLRVDDHSEFGSHVSPKISFMYEPFENTHIRGSVGMGFKSPTIRQMYYSELYQHGDYWYRSNPDLEAEKSVGYSLSLEQIIKDKIMIDLSLFRNDIKDKVLQIDTGEYEDDLPIVSFKNVSKAYTQGIELCMKAILSKGFSTTLSYTFTDTEDEDSGNELTYVPANNVTLGFDYRYEPFKVNFNINAQYADEMFTDDSNMEKTNDYMVVDAKISKKFKKYYTVSVEANNLTDSDYGQADKEWLGTTWLVKLKMDI